jgi:hypothetical protein
MIIEPNEVHRFESACRVFSKERVLNAPPAETIYELLPSILAAYKYSEIAFGHQFKEEYKQPRKLSFWDCFEGRQFYHHPDGRWFDPFPPSFDSEQRWLGWSQTTMAEMCRARSLWRGKDDSLYADGVEIITEYVEVAPSLEAVLEAAWQAATTPLEKETLVVSPTFWGPYEQRRQLDAIQTTAKSVIAATRAQTLKLEDLTWKQLEEIVAYVLSSRGMKIHVVKESPQGGRDVVAYGELIPGFEPVTLAVEVKHKGVVNRPEVQMALWQNRHFPALLFVTSGRFSSGVISEGRLAENRMRLHLWDGVTLHRLIKML